MKDKCVQDHMNSLESILCEKCDHLRLASHRMSRYQAEQLKKQVAEKYRHLKAEIAHEEGKFFSVVVSETITQTQQEVNP